MPWSTSRWPLSGPVRWRACVPPSSDGRRRIKLRSSRMPRPCPSPDAPHGLARTPRRPTTASSSYRSRHRCGALGTSDRAPVDQPKRSVLSTPPDLRSNPARCPRSSRSGTQFARSRRPADRRQTAGELQTQRRTGCWPSGWRWGGCGVRALTERIAAADRRRSLRRHPPGSGLRVADAGGGTSRFVPFGAARRCCVRRCCVELCQRLLLDLRTRSALTPRSGATSRSVRSRLPSP